MVPHSKTSEIADRGKHAERAIFPQDLVQITERPNVVPRWCKPEELALWIIRPTHEQKCSDEQDNKPKEERMMRKARSGIVVEFALKKPVNSKALQPFAKISKAPKPQVRLGE
jgi:hypothetical protein